LEVTVHLGDVLTKAHDWLITLHHPTSISPHRPMHPSR
jgi:hypothetical protein